MAIGAVLLIIALAELGLGLRFIFGYQKSPSTIFYGLFCVAVSIYVGSNGLGYVRDSFYIGERFGWAGGALTAALFLPFSFSFPIPRRSYRELLPWILWPLAIFPIGFIATDLFVRELGIVSFRSGYQRTTGPYFWFFLVFFLLYWSWSLLNLIKSYFASDGIHRWQLKMILIGISTSLLFAIAFDIILPLLTRSRFGYAGSLFTSVWLFFTAFVLLKK